MLPFASPEYGTPQLHMLYEDIYKPGRYPNLWFIWKGKPCIMAQPEYLSDSEEDQEIADFSLSARGNRTTSMVLNEKTTGDGWRSTHKTATPLFPMVVLNKP